MRHHDPGRAVLNHAAVLGRPIAHSLSPVLHRAAYAALGLAWTYDALDCGVDELPGVLAARADWAGVSCTMPLKRAALELADVADELAVSVGAANTLIPLPGGGWQAFATDVHGIVQALGLRVGPRSAVVLGAGGTAQNALAALARLGLTTVDVLVRDTSRTSELRAAADRLGLTTEVGVLDLQASALAADVVVSTLPPGAADALAGREWDADQVLLDVVYDPWPTPLATAVTAAGATVRSGASMLLFQAAAQVELMTGQPAPVEAMRAALLAAHPSCGA